MKRAKPPHAETGKRTRERRLSQDEVNLWQHVASSIAPEKKAKPHVRRRGTAANEDDVSPPAPETAAALPTREMKPRPSLRKSAPTPSAPPAPYVPPVAPAKSPAKSKVPALADFDRRKARHIARGREDIDARLDLHGLRQSEARHRLEAFLHAAQTRGHRTVLVITGKGSGTPHDPLGAALGEPQRGVLRRLVPQWLSEPDLRALVVSYTTASIRHGGDGALYVHMRRTDR